MTFEQSNGLNDTETVAVTAVCAVVLIKATSTAAKDGIQCGREHIDTVCALIRRFVVALKSN